MYRNESAYTRPMSVSTSGNRKGFILQGVTADLNGTELACSLGEVASAFLPVLIISKFNDARVSLAIITGNDSTHLAIFFKPKKLIVKLIG